LDEDTRNTYKVLSDSIGDTINARIVLRYNLGKFQDLAWLSQYVDLARGLTRKLDLDSRRGKVYLFTKTRISAVWAHSAIYIGGVSPFSHLYRRCGPIQPSIL
jgi:hypothetical protein